MRLSFFNVSSDNGINFIGMNHPSIVERKASKHDTAGRMPEAVSVLEFSL